MSADREFWNRRDDWERLPRRPIAVVVALGGLLLGGMAFVAVPRGGSHRAVQRPVLRAEARQLPAPQADAPPLEIVPVSVELPAEVSALPVVAPSIPPPAVLSVPARQSDRPATPGGRGSSTSAEAVPAAPAPPQAPPQPAPPPAPGPSCVVDVLDVCVQNPIG